MKRRTFFKHTLGHAVCSAAALTLPGGRVFAAPEDYTGRLFVTLQAAGAWDVSSFCDPKVNQAGEREITQWSRSADIQTAGNIQYAPYGNNAAFFNKYYQNILVVNGVDAQTNAHSTGVLHNWSGRNSAGYPSLTAMFAAMNAPELPLSYINFGGYSETAKLIRYTRLNDINSLINVLTPNNTLWNPDENYQAPSTLSLIKQRQLQRLDRLRSNQRLPRESYTMDAYYQARANAQSLADFAEVIPATDDLESSVAVTAQSNSTLRTQMQMALLAFSSGSACAADLYLDGFDTHSNHDADQEPTLAHLVDSIDYFWEYAATLGLADRITLMVTSDFSRTPFYNSSNGKDHWPIGSVMFMEANPSWGNRVVGSTDETQNANAINATTLQTDANGILLYPKHIHLATRNYLGIGSDVIASPFPLNNTEALNLFG